MGTEQARLREHSFPRPPRGELDCGARSFTDDTERGRVGWAWRGRAAAGGRVALARAVPPQGIRKYESEIDSNVQNMATTLLYEQWSN